MKKNILTLLIFLSDITYVAFASIRSIYAKMNPRKLTRLSVVLFLLLSGEKAGAQSPLLNGDFESWTSSSHSEVQGWKSNNSYTGKPVIMVSEVTGVTGNAVRIAVTGSSGSPYVGGIYNFQGSVTSGGAPYTGGSIPTHFKGYYRCSLAKDSSVIYLVRKKAGVALAIDTLYITGAQSTFKAFDFTLHTISAIPDSIVFDASAGTYNLSNFSTLAVVGDFIELDELSFSNGSAALPFPNGSFDTWNTITNETPDSWQANGSVTKSADKQSGSYSAKLTTQDNGSGVEPGTIFGSTISLSGNVDTLKGYYKYSTPGADKGYIEITFWDHNGTGASLTKDYLILPTTGYTAFSIPLANTINASDFNFLVSSSYNTPPVNGSNLLIDNLQLKIGWPLSIANHDSKEQLSVYPNPASGTVHIIGAGPDALVTAYNMYGQMVQSATLNNGDMDVHNLQDGIYNCIIQNNGQAQHTRITIANH